MCFGTRHRGRERRAYVGESDKPVFGEPEKRCKQQCGADAVHTLEKKCRTLHPCELDTGTPNCARNQSTVLSNTAESRALVTLTGARFFSGLLQFVAALQGLLHGDFVGIFDVAAGGNAGGNAGDFDTRRL